eukprot:2751558-Prorocentrum_lima.AAC.1
MRPREEDRKGCQVSRKGNKRKNAGSVSASADCEDYDQENADSWYEHDWDQHEYSEEGNQHPDTQKTI